MPLNAPRRTASFPRFAGIASASSKCGATTAMWARPRCAYGSSVRQWPITSRCDGPRTGRPPAEGVHVDYAHPLAKLGMGWSWRATGLAALAAHGSGRSCGRSSAPRGGRTATVSWGRRAGVAPASGWRGNRNSRSSARACTRPCVSISSRRAYSTRPRTVQDRLVRFCQRRSGRATPSSCPSSPSRGSGPPITGRA